MSLPPQFLDELRTRLPLSEVVGRRLRLTRAGREHKACCPFHNEKTPSFTVNDQKGFFHCFGCGAHGDIIGFVMQHDRLSFIDAVELLAAQAGLAVPKATPEERERFERRKGLHALVEAATAFFEAQLRAPAGRAALDYLRRRGLDDEAIARFRLGYAPADGQVLVKALAAQGFDEAAMIETGLARRPEDGRSPYAFFRNRVMFPVTDRRGQPVAFGGRIMDGDRPKYINSPDGPLFHKGELLYGLSRARVAASQGQRLIVAEGYLDVIALVRAGFEAAVAPLGTALTDKQIEELWKLSPGNDNDVFEPIICFDGDEAGRRAAERAVDRILPQLKPGYSVRFVFMPEGEDPDSLLRSHGTNSIKTLMSNAVSLSDVIWSNEIKGRTFGTPDELVSLKQSLIEKARLINSNIVQKQYLQDFADRCYWLWRSKSKSRTLNLLSVRLDEIMLKGPGEFRPKAESILIGLILACPQLVHDYNEEIMRIDFINPELNMLRGTIMQNLSDNPEINSQGLYALLHDQGEIENVTRVQRYVNIYLSRKDDPDHEKRVAETFKHVLLRYYQKNLETQIKEAGEAFRAVFTSENFRRLQILQSELQRVHSAVAPGSIYVTRQPLA